MCLRKGGFEPKGEEAEQMRSLKPKGEEEKHRRASSRKAKKQNRVGLRAEGEKPIKYKTDFAFRQRREPPLGGV